jgi:hypothetical protein
MELCVRFITFVWEYVAVMWQQLRSYKSLDYLNKSFCLFISYCVFSSSLIDFVLLAFILIISCMIHESVMIKPWLISDIAGARQIFHKNFSFFHFLGKFSL